MSNRTLLSTVLLVGVLLAGCRLVGQFVESARPIDVELGDSLAEGDFDRAKQLLEEGADINAQFSTRDGYTTLMMAAAATDHPQPFELLLKNGADPDIRDDVRGYTALMLAAVSGHSQTAALLLEYGADPSVTGADGETALSLARKRERTDIVALLESRKP